MRAVLIVACPRTSTGIRCIRAIEDVPSRIASCCARRRRTREGAVAAGFIGRGAPRRRRHALSVSPGRHDGRARRGCRKARVPKGRAAMAARIARFASWRSTVRHAALPEAPQPPGHLVRLALRSRRAPLLSPSVFPSASRATARELAICRVRPFAALSRQAMAAFTFREISSTPPQGVRCRGLRGRGGRCRRELRLCLLPRRNTDWSCRCVGPSRACAATCATNRFDQTSRAAERTTSRGADPAHHERGREAQQGNLVGTIDWSFAPQMGRYRSRSLTRRSGSARAHPSPPRRENRREQWDFRELGDVRAVGRYEFMALDSRIAKPSFRGDHVRP
jgi:hypothetical protein